MSRMPSLRKRSSSGSGSGGSGEVVQRERPPTPPLHMNNTSNNSSKSKSANGALRSGRFGTSSTNTILPSLSLSRSNSSLDDNNVANNFGSGNTNNNGGEDYDPLMTLFRVHHNNRVQFDLDPSNKSSKGGGAKGGGGSGGEASSRKPRLSSGGGDSGGNSNAEKSPKFNIKKFVRSAIFTNSNSNNNSGGGNSSDIDNNDNDSSSGSGTKPLLSKNKDGSFNSSYIDDDDDEDDPENALIKKMLLPSPPKRLGSFLKSRVVGGNNSSSNSNDNKCNMDKGEIDKLEEKFLLPPNSTLSSSTKLPPPPSSSSSSPTFTYSNIKQHSSPQSTTTTTTATSPTKQSKERIAKLLKKGQRSHKKHFRYRHAMKYYLLALKEMTSAGYIDTHPLITKVLKSLNDVHHAQSVLGNSANIVKMGIQHEDSNGGGQSTSSSSSSLLVKALKMYTIAYRMRRDALGVDHPSLPVLLNMMGSVQVKRGEYNEAMQIYHLALRGRPDENGGRGRNTEEFRMRNPLTTSVTLRDMGMILEHRGGEEQALRFYHSSLKYAVKFRSETMARNNGKGGGNNGGGGGDYLEDDDVGSAHGSTISMDSGSEVEVPLTNSSSKEDEFGFLDQLVYSTDNNGDSSSSGSNNNNADQQGLLELFDDEPFSLDEVRMVKSTTIVQKAENDAFTPFSADNGKPVGVASTSEDECGEMELFLEKRFDKLAMTDAVPPPNDGSVKKFYYDELFVKSPSSTSSSPKISNSKSAASEVSPASAAGGGANTKWEGSDVDIAMTLHQIGQIHRRSLRYAAALSAYNASLRGMKEVLGSRHANIAAILGNIGNLYMELGDYDEAFQIYQEVLGIETLHLGLSHPEVAVTLHNIATIECSRGNFSEGVSLYKQVVDMQKLRFGPHHITVAVTLSCLADANEKLGNVAGAIRTYEEALQIRRNVMGRSHIDVGRILHKLGRLAASQDDYGLANLYITSSARIYADNKLKSDHPFLREMARDMADIQAGLAFSGSRGIAV